MPRHAPPPPFSPVKERVAWGRARRAALPRTSLARWEPAPGRADPVELLARATAARVPALLPIKWARMAASPFGFFRGAVPVMAADLARLPRSGIAVQLCGDAHVRNLGAYAAPDGHLVFDINDFDESLPGPFEWDLMRLAASFVLAGREAGDSEAACRDAVETLARSWRTKVREFLALSPLALFRVEVRRARGTGPVERVLAKAERESPAGTLARLTVAARGGERRFAHRPPLLFPVREETEKRVLAALRSYRETVSHDRQLVLDAYRPVDVAFKVVGTGSVGARDYVVLHEGAHAKAPLFLQVKQELPSAWAPYLRAANGHEGRRVAQAQHRIQTVSDPFLGWATVSGRPYLVRQLADHKASIAPEELRGAGLAAYARVAGELFAKAHCRTGDAAALAGWCGASDKLDRALRKFAVAYAERTTEDWGTLRKAVRRGRLRAAERTLTREALAAAG